MTDSTHKLLHRFRTQFIVMNIIFALAVLSVVLGAVAGISWKQHLDDVYSALDARINMTGKFGGGDLGMGAGFGAIDPHVMGDSDAGFGLPTDAQGTSEQAGTTQDFSSSTSSDVSSNAAEEASGTTPEAADGAQGAAPSSTGQQAGTPPQDGLGPQDGGTPQREGGPRTFQREMSSDQFVATALYFADKEGNVVSGHNEAFSIDDDMLAEALAIALASENASAPEGAEGHIGDLNLYYKVRYTHDDDYVVAFASGKYIERNMLSLAASLVLPGLVAVLAFALISFILSRWVTRPVENAWTQQQQFIADASHELKTPLTVITANDSILLSQPEATIESQRQWIESTETEAHLMQELVNDMLYLAKSDAAKQPLEYGQVDISELATLQLLQFESVAFEKGAQIESDVQEGVKLYADQTRVQRLIAILLDNACKYVDEGGQIEATLRATDKVCVLQVRNTGPVVDPEDIPHLFDRFYRSDKARTRGAGGFGLGLSIAKSIVDDHKGTIRVTSTAERGTTFTVELPLGR